MYMYKVEKGIPFFHSLMSQKMLYVMVSALNYQLLIVSIYNIVMVIYSTMPLFISKNFFHFFPILNSQISFKKTKKTKTTINPDTVVRGALIKLLS